MKLLIISNMSHHLKDGQVVGWGPTVEEINHLSTLFESVRHLGCMHDTAAPDSALPYSAKNISLVPLPPAGGNTISDKWKIVTLLPLYLKQIIKELRNCDAVHVRCPANIPMFALLVFIFAKKPSMRWVKYAGNWGAGREYPFFFRLQRWLLKTGLCRCETTINGTWPNQGTHIHSFYNPCLTEQEVDLAKVSSEKKEFTPPYRLLFVGALNDKKGAGRLLEIASRLLDEKVPFVLDILGDGPDISYYEDLCEKRGLVGHVTFHGWVPKNRLSSFYSQAHINILPSESEGWPKVLSEGMAFGVVPLAGAVASIPQILSETRSGVAISPYDNTSAYVKTILDWIADKENWKAYSINSQESASRFTYEYYLKSVRILFSHCWDARIA